MAFNELGGKCLLACEIREHARQVYKANFEVDHPFPYDITEVPEIPECDIVCAGFPCQSFSVGGLQKGLDDERGQLYTHIVRLCKETPPKALFLENVKGLIKLQGGRVLSKIEADFEGIGYKLRCYETDVREWNIPQPRKRVFLIGFKEGGAIKPPLPPYSLGNVRKFGVYTGTYSLNDLMKEAGVLEKDEECVREIHRTLRGKDGDRPGKWPDGYTRLPVESVEVKKLETAYSLTGTRTGKGDNARSKRTMGIYDVMREGGPEDTYPKEVNDLAAKLLMGFPKDFRIDATFRSYRRPLLGNAVVPRTVKPYCEAILKVLRDQ